MESDEERERKAKKPRRAKAEAGAVGSGDEAGEPKKKRRGKLKKAAEGEEEQAVFSDEDENTDRPLKKVMISLAVVLTSLLRLVHSCSGAPRKELSEMMKMKLRILAKSNCE